MADSNLDNMRPDRLASIVDLEPSTERLWQPDELAAILRHQLSLSVQLDLAAMGSAEPMRLPTLTAAHGLQVDSFADLLTHPNPPIEPLVKLKDFAKACAGNPGSTLPSEVAKVLYYLAISVAILRCRQRITSMTDAELSASLNWAIDLPWVEPRERGVLEQAAARMKPPD